MARALRVEIPGGRYHITARGNERRAIFRQDTDRIRLLELLSELPARFGVRLHAYVLSLASGMGTGDARQLSGWGATQGGCDCPSWRSWWAAAITQRWGKP